MAGRLPVRVVLDWLRESAGCRPRAVVYVSDEADASVECALRVTGREARNACNSAARPTNISDAACTDMYR